MACTINYWHDIIPAYDTDLYRMMLERTQNHLANINIEFDPRPTAAYVETFFDKLRGNDYFDDTTFPEGRYIVASKDFSIGVNIFATEDEIQDLLDAAV